MIGIGLIFCRKHRLFCALFFHCSTILYSVFLCERGRAKTPVFVLVFPSVVVKRCTADRMFCFSVCPPDNIVATSTTPRRQFQRLSRPSACARVAIGPTSPLARCVEFNSHTSERWTHNHFAKAKTPCLSGTKLQKGYLRQFVVSFILSR